MGDVDDAREEVQVNELVVTREVAAPTGAVWTAWSESSHLMQWWAPMGSPAPAR